MGPRSVNRFLFMHDKRALVPYPAKRADGSCTLRVSHRLVYVCILRNVYLYNLYLIACVCI